MSKKLESKTPVAAATTCSIPPYDEWRKLPPDEAARILAKHRNLDAEQEGLIAAILEHFDPSPKVRLSGKESTP